MSSSARGLSDEKLNTQIDAKAYLDYRPARFSLAHPFLLPKFYRINSIEGRMYHARLG